MEIVKPIVITDNETNEVFTLEFNRESVVFTNNQGFKATELVDNAEEMIPILFYGAFRKNHKNISRQRTDAILFDKLQGLSKEVLERLIELYTAPRSTLFRENEGHSENPKVVVSL